MKWSTRRRMATRRAHDVRTDAERIAEVAGQAGEPVHEVLKAVSDFRLALEMDMILAAAAADADRPEVAADVLGNERLELASFQDRVLDRLVDLEVAETPQRRVRHPMPGARLVAAAAALVGLLGGATAMRIQQQAPEVSPTSAREQLVEDANEKLGELSQQVALRENDKASAASVAAAATELHQTLKPLLDQAHTDPVLARKVFLLLAAEQQVLSSGNPAGIRAVLGEARALVRSLRRRVPPSVLAPVQESAKPKPKASPSRSSKPSPKPTPTASPSPTASPEPSQPPSTASPAPFGPSQQPLP